MGRRPTKNLNLPPRIRRRRRGKKDYYFYDKGGKPRVEIPLGTDYVMMLKKYAELEQVHNEKISNAVTFDYVAKRYLKDVTVTKSPATQRDNARELQKLLQFFNSPQPAPLEQIKPMHIRAYLDKRSAKVRANREIALFSTIWNMAREWGYTDKENPCRNVTRNKEQARTKYVEDDEYLCAWYAADEPLRDAMDLLYCTAQRPADVLKFAEPDVKKDAITHVQNKTGKRQDITITPTLSAVLSRIMERKAQYKIRSLKLVVNEEGQPLGKDALRSRFDKVREQTGVDFQLRDVRAKAITDKTLKTDSRLAQLLAGHSTVKMTERYIRKGKAIDATE